MKTNEEKLTCQYCVNFDNETSQQIEKLARYYNRKPSEFLRLIIAPVLRQWWAEMERNEHEENRQEPTLARFKK